METLNVGIIGFGLSGKDFHAKILKDHPGYQIVKVCSSRTGEIKSYLPKAQPVNDAQEIINDQEIDLVINASTNDHHYDFTAAALESSKHVVVEKPFTNTIEEAEKLIALAKKQNKVLSVFHNRRWDPDFLELKEKIREGELGEVMIFESHFDRFRPKVDPEKWREQKGPGTGVFFDLGPHLVDQATCLFGEPDSVISDLENQRPGAEVNDYFHLILKYGKKRVILQGSCYSDKSFRFFVQGSKSSYIKHGVVDGDYTPYYDELYNCITKDGKNPVSAEEALTVMKTILLAYRS